LTIKYKIISRDNSGIWWAMKMPSGIILLFCLQ
jgi:hypothetical protein